MLPIHEETTPAYANGRRPRSTGPIGHLPGGVQVLAPSIKAGLDIDWTDPKQMHQTEKHGFLRPTPNPRAWPEDDAHGRDLGDPRAQPRLARRAVRLALRLCATSIADRRSAAPEAAPGAGNQRAIT